MAAMMGGMGLVWLLVIVVLVLGVAALVKYPVRTLAIHAGGCASFARRMTASLSASTSEGSNASNSPVGFMR